MRGGALQVWDGLGGIVGEPEGDAQVVLCGGEFGIEGERLFEMAEGFVAAVEDGEEEADLVLNAGGVGIERGGFFPGSECGGGVASCAGGGGLRFQVAELRRLGRDRATAANKRMKDRPGGLSHVRTGRGGRVATFSFEQDLRWRRSGPRSVNRPARSAGRDSRG